MKRVDANERTDRELLEMSVPQHVEPTEGEYHAREKGDDLESERENPTATPCDVGKRYARQRGLQRETFASPGVAVRPMGEMPIRVGSDSGRCSAALPAQLWWEIRLTRAAAAMAEGGEHE